MQMPTKKFTVLDEERGVRYVVLGYRQPTRQEALQMVFLQRQQERRKPKKGSVIQILTSIGA